MDGLSSLFVAMVMSKPAKVSFQNILYCSVVFSKYGSSTCCFCCLQNQVTFQIEFMQDFSVFINYFLLSPAEVRMPGTRRGFLHFQIPLRASYITGSENENKKCPLFGETSILLFLPFYFRAGLKKLGQFCVLVDWVLFKVINHI